MRFLVAIPILMLAEIPIGGRLRRVAAHFVEAGLVREEERGWFAEIIAATIRMRDSRVAELVVLAAAYLTAYEAHTHTMVHGAGIWHASEAGGAARGSASGTAWSRCRSFSSCSTGGSTGCRCGRGFSAACRRSTSV